MKQYFILLAAVTFTINSFGQLDKTNWLIGGNGTFNSFNHNYQSTVVNSESNVTEIKTTPNIGYFVVDKLAVGLKSSFSWRKEKEISAGAGKSNIIRFDYGPFIRYYFLDKEKPFNLLVDLTYQFGNLNFIPGDKGIRNNFSVVGGPVLYFNSSLGIEFLLGYRIEKEKLVSTSSIPQNLFNDTKKGFQFSIGFQIHLEKL